MVYLEEYMEKNPQDGTTYKLLADFQLYQGEIEGAIQLYERASLLTPENAETHAALGKLYVKRLNYDKAAQHYEKASSLRPEEPYYKAHLAYAYNRLGRHDEAVTIAQKLTQEYEDDSIATLVLACVYFNAGEYENAIEEFNRVLQYEESYQTLLDDMDKFLAITYLKAGKPEAMNLNPWTPIDIIDDCTEEGDYDGILQMAISGIKNQQDAWKPMWAQGNLIRSFFESGGQIDKLLGTFEQELKNEPDNPLIYKMLGYIYESMGRRYRQTEKFSAAEEMFQKALLLTTDSKLKAEIYYHLGDMYQMQKQYDKAIPVYQEVIKLSPKDIDARQRLAHIYERIKQYEKAIPIYQRLIELDKGSADAYKKFIEQCSETSR